MVTEIHIGTDFGYDPVTFINISYALVQFESTWLMVAETRSQNVSTYLVRLMNDQVSVINGFLFIKGDDLIDTLQGAYILGTLTKRRYPHNKHVTIGKY